MFCERSGIVNIALEGKLLAAAFAGAANAHVTGSAWLGLFAGIGVSVFALLHGFASITHRGDQVVSGMAINILAAGLTITLGRHWFQQGGQTPALSGDARFAPSPSGADAKDVLVGLPFVSLSCGPQILVYMVVFIVQPAGTC